ncbi:hypothetical protein PFISCL1PPCAC_14462, partial [Pristionchus fissidentatus]
CGTLVQFPMLFNVDVRMDSENCRKIIFLPVMGVAIGCSCILCVGIDRLFAIHASNKYRMMDKRIYYSILALMIVAYCCYDAALIIIYRHPEVVYCEIVSPFHGDALDWFSRGHLTVISCTVVVYVSLWNSLRSNKSKGEKTQELYKYTILDVRDSGRIVRSLLIIASVDIGGWILTPATTQIMLALRLKGDEFFAWMQLSTLFINIAVSIKFFIYFSTRCLKDCKYRS